LSVEGRTFPACVGTLGRALEAAVERFVLVGETIADDNPEIKLDLYEACREARSADKIWSFRTLI
jgi:hypothetical protein